MTIRPKDPAAALQRDREWRERSAERYQDRLRERVRNGEQFARRTTEIAEVNPERRKKLYEKQFGPKGDSMKGMPCWVTGDEGTGFWPVDNAHVDGTRGAGADASMLARLRRDVHRSFDNDTDAVFENKWGTSKEWVRDAAREFDVIYQAKRAETEAMKADAQNQGETTSDV